MLIEKLYFKRAKCKSCGLEQNIALANIPQFKTFEQMRCRGCGSQEKTEIFMEDKKINNWKII